MPGNVPGNATKLPWASYEVTVVPPIPPHSTPQSATNTFASGAAVGAAVGAGVAVGAVVGAAEGLGDGLGTGFTAPVDCRTWVSAAAHSESEKFVPLAVKVTLRPLPCGCRDVAV